MNPSRTKTIKGKLVQQYYWAGRDVVYIDHRLVLSTFDAITEDTIDTVNYSNQTT